MAQLKDLTIDVAERVGSVADAAEALGKAGINIEGICGFVVNGKGILHLLVEDSAKARTVLQGAGARVTAEENAAVFDIEDRPGTLGQLTRKIAAAGVNLSAVYLATRTRVVIAARELEKARAAAGQTSSSHR